MRITLPSWLGATSGRFVSAGWRRPRYAAPLLVIGLFLAAACTGNDPAPTPVPPAPTAAPTATATPEPTPVQATGSGIEGGDPEFNLAAMVWQGYWLSRNHFGPFVMASGMGISFEPPMEMVMGAMKMVAKNADDPAMIPQNMLPLQAVFASGGSDLANDPREFEPLDFEGFRLDPAGFDETVAVRGQAYTMLKESQWAHTFSNPYFGTPTDSFGAQQRFMGVMVNMLAQMQAQYAMKNLMGEDGLYHDSDGGLDYVGNWAMLHALSDIAGLTAEGRYANPDMNPMFEKAATGLFRALEERDPDSPEEAATAVRALIYRASTTPDPALREDSLERARSIADEKLVGYESEDSVGNAAAIAGLIAAAAASDSTRYQGAADSLYEKLSADFDPAHGVFNSRNAYGVDDVAWIIGGLNSLFQQGSPASRDSAGKMLLAFYESTMSLAGMQLSAPPGKNGAMAGDWEKNLPSVLFYHPADTPPPPAVGKLPVPAEEIRWDGESWQVTSDRFVPAGAMHLANELNWLGPHLGSIPFPEVGTQAS